MSDDLEIKNAPIIRSVRRDHDLPSVPDRQLNFVGRTSELEQLAEYFAHDGKSRVVVLWGLGGVGKTTLAAALAHRLAPNFPDGVFFHRAEGEDIQELLSETIRQLAPTARVPFDPRDRLSLYRNLLAGKQVLTILDDVRDEETVRSLIPPAPSALLITSRRNLDLAGVEQVELGGLPLAEAVTLLRSNLNPERTFKANELVQLAEGMHRFPLSLRVAAAYLNSNPRVSIAEWLSRISTQGGGPSLREVIKDGIARLLKTSRVPPERIGVLGVFEGRFTAGAVRAIWEVDEDTASTTLNTLLDAGMIATLDGRFDIHDVVRGYLRENFHLEINSIRHRHAAHYLRELHEIAERYHEPSERRAALDAFEASRADIEAGHAWAEKAAPTFFLPRSLLIGYATAGFELFASQLPPAKWIGWIRSALVECERARHGERSLLHYALGVALINQGDLTEAQTQLRDCIEIARENNDRGMEGAARGALGLVYSQTGHIQKAIVCYEDSLAIARSISDVATESNAIGNLGIAYANMGDLSRAIECFERQLTIVHSRSDIAGEANAIGNLGLCRRAQNDLEGALRLFERQLELSRKLDDVRVEASALSNLGNIMLSRGDLIGATRAFEEAISIARRFNDRWQEGRLIGNLGNAYLAADQFAAAIDAYAQQAELARQLGDRVGEGNALWNSAIAFEAHGNIEEAIARARVAFDIRRELNDPNLAKTLDWLRAHGIEANPHR